MDKIQPIIDALTSAYKYIQESGILERIVDAVREYAPKLVEMIKGIAG